MQSLNEIKLIGNLGADIELSYTGQGTARATFRVATTESWKAQGSDEWQERTEWHRCVLFGKAAERIAERCSKGWKIFITGKLQYGTFEKQGVTQHSTEIVVSDFLPLAAPAARTEA